MMKKFLKTTLCAVLAVSFATSTVFGADNFNWEKFLNSKKPYTQKQKEQIDKLAVNLTATSTNDGITISARKLIGTNDVVYIALDITSNNGVKLPETKYLAFSGSRTTSSMDPKKVSTINIFHKDYVLNLSDWVTLMDDTRGAINKASYTYGEDISDYKKILYFSCYDTEFTDAKGVKTPDFSRYKIIFNLLTIVNTDPKFNVSGQYLVDDPKDVNPKAIVSKGSWYLEVPLDHPVGETKEYAINKSYTKKIKGKDRLVTIKKVRVTPLTITVDGTVEREEGERIGFDIYPTIKLKDGRVLETWDVKTEFTGTFREIADIGKDGKNIQSIIIGDVEYKVN